MSDRPKPTDRQKSLAGEHFVAAELHRRGAYASLLSKNMPKIDLIASDRNHKRTIYIQVKTKAHRGRWHGDTRHGLPEPKHDETRFWVLVDISEEPVAFYVLPEWWMQNCIYREYQAYLARHGGQRPRNLDSTDHSILVEHVAEWRDRWDVLGIFGDDVR